MSSLTTRIKRLGRIALSGLGTKTKVALVQAEFGRERSTAVPIGDRTAWIDEASADIDYFTLYGAIVDEHFSCDVDGAAVLDIGAHKGYFALRCLADGATRVDSYEPASQNLRRLRESASASEEMWNVFGNAVGATAGSVELYLAPGSWGHSVHVPVGGESVGTETVEMVALSDALARISEHGRPVVAKINVEGAAGEMILGTQPSDWSNVRLLWTDIEENDPVSVTDIVAKMRTCGLEHARTEVHRNLFVRP